jgi:hypothetical protein
MEHLPLTTFKRCVAHYGGEHKVKHFSCLDQYLCMAFAQLTWRESLRDIEACLRAHSTKLIISASAALRTRLDHNRSVPSVFSWAPFRSTKAAVKLHTLLDLRGSIPAFIFISDGKFHDVNVLDDLVPEPGAFYVMDRAYIDFERLANDAGSFFVTRAKSNFRAQRRYSHAVDRATGLVCDQTVVGFYSRKGLEAPLRRVKFNDPEMASGSYSSRTTLHCRHSRSPSCTGCAGVWNCFSNGSNSTCESRRSSAQPRTQ